MFFFFSVFSPAPYTIYYEKLFLLHFDIFYMSWSSILFSEAVGVGTPLMPFLSLFWSKVYFMFN